MKKLYVNIERIHIVGDISQLSELVKQIDVSLQNLTDYTDRLTAYLVRNSNENYGRQYQVMVEATNELRKELYQASMDFNDLQRQVILFQNKIYRYEDISASAAAPNPYLVKMTQINVNTSGVQYNLQEMRNLVATLHNYSEAVMYHIRNISARKNEAARFWRDEQYRDFADFIEQIIQHVERNLRGFDEYISYLEEKIRELS